MNPNISETVDQPKPFEEIQNEESQKQTSLDEHEADTLAEEALEDVSGGLAKEAQRDYRWL